MVPEFPFAETITPFIKTNSINHNYKRHHDYDLSNTHLKMLKVV